MNILKTSVHQINHAASEVRLLPAASDNQDLVDYIYELLEKIARADSKRKFRFASATGEVNNLITRITAGEDFNTQTTAIADRLMRKEQNAQADIEHLKHDIQKGVVFHILFEDDEVTKLIISKADHAEYLDDQDLKKRKGLPKKKKTYKAFLVEFSEALAVGELYVYDTNATISRYWWDNFLELDEVNTDTHNTDEAFNAIDKKILGKIKKEYPADHNILRNRIIGYFRSNESFELEGFIENAIGDYDPVDPRLKVAALKKQIRELPEKQGFDSQFTIKPEVIKAKRVRNIVPLSEKIDLYIKEYVEDLQEIITPEIDNGIKYIRIKTDTGYEAFKNVTQQ